MGSLDKTIIEVKSKICTKCKILTLYSDFYANNNTYDKLNNKCKKCCKEANKKYQQKYRKKCVLESLTSLDKRIIFWCRKWRRGGTHSYKSEARKELNKTKKLVDLDILIQLCKNSLIEYPYISFYNNTPEYNSPSVDRIDNKLMYSDTNIQIIPFWLNLAKCQMEQDFF